MYKDNDQEDYSYMYPQTDNMYPDFMNQNPMYSPYDTGNMGNLMMPGEPENEAQACQMIHMCQHMGYMYLAEACRIQAMYCCGQK